jgi:hypothetical protein
MREIFSALDVDKISDLPGELGAYDPESVCVRYNFTRDEYSAAMRSIPGGDELPDPIKTVVHETTHLLHMTTTPFGILLYRLRGLQTHLVTDAIRRIRTRGAEVRFPLQKTFRTLPRDLSQDVEQFIQGWYGIELLVLVMMGERDVWLSHILNNPYLKGVSLGEIFANVQNYLARSQAAQQDLSSFIPEDAGNYDTRREAQLLTFDILAGGANTLGILESAGTMSEYFGNTKLTLDQFRASIEGSRWASTTAPKSWMLEALRTLRAETLAEFAMSYLACCEVALCGPALPEHRSLRKSGINTSDVIPFLRWYQLITAASKTPPLRTVDDYQRYVTELCDAAGLTPPRETVRTSVESSPQMPKDPVEIRYWKAQRIRLEAPGAFLNYRLIIARLPVDFDFPVIAYKDRTMFLKDKVSVHISVMTYLTRALVRKMLLRTELTVGMPYSPTAEEKAFYTNEVNQVMEDGLGFRVPGVSIS